MAQKPAADEGRKTSRGRSIIRGAVAFLFVGLLGFGGYQALLHPDTPLPTAWNPTRPLVIDDPVTPFTGWKLNRAAADITRCEAVLTGAAAWRRLADLETSDQCHIRGRVALSQVGSARIGTVETRCAIALRLAMWERHSLQPAARDIIGADLAAIDHIGSYSCRAMRTTDGGTGRMSTHATADAIDITGFRFTDGQTIRLVDDWSGNGPAASFLRAARDGACDWFSLTLSPDYNTLHADHFHLQSKGWGLCR